MIIIQSDSERKLAHHFDCSCALYGAIENAESYRLTSFEEIQSGKLNELLKNNLAVGSTDFMREVFKQLNVGDVRLPMNSNRKSEIITLKEAYDRVASGKKIFIKPIELKLFTGLVLDGMRYTALNGLPDDTKVLAYEPFNKKILSEWRLYVYRNEIVDARNYSGDFSMMPDFHFAKHVVKENIVHDFPIAYTVDIGIFEFGSKPGVDFDGTLYDVWGNEAAVIEFNDMWAIGNYGIPNDLYLSLLKNRYFQIIRSRKNNNENL